MATTGKTIKQFSLTTALQQTDGILVQRGNSYYYTNAQNITTGAIVEDTYANVTAAKTGDNLVRGATYYITDKYVFLFALDSNKFDLSGVFFARNADYQASGIYVGITTTNGFTVNATGTNLGIWTLALTPASGDVVIWNNLHWLNITGANGATNPTLDAVNWEAVANTDIDVANTYGYIYEFDAVEYNFDIDTINRRVDSRGNDVSDSDGVSLFQWGNDSVYNNKINVISTLSITNQLGEFYNNIIQSPIDEFETKSTTIFRGNQITGSNQINFSFIDRVGANYNGNRFDISGKPKVFVYPLEAALDNVFITKIQSSFEIDVKLTATAYNAGTNYSFGDFATSGTVTYLYINAESSVGNAPPNATYWQEVYNFTTLGRFKLTISKWLNMY